MTEAEWEGLAPEIREFEPREALVAGPGGLEAIESLLEQIARAGELPAAIALEVGAGQADAVAELVAFGRVRDRGEAQRPRGIRAGRGRTPR